LEPAEKFTPKLDVVAVNEVMFGANGWTAVITNDWVTVVAAK
jgi:hypothetical protein